MSNRQLMVLDQKDPFANPELSLKESERILQEIVARNEQKLQADLSEFFFNHDGADFDMIVDTMTGHLEEALSSPEATVAETKIEVADDPLYEKEFANSQAVFEKIKQDDKRRANGEWLFYDPEEETKKATVELLSAGGRSTTSNSTSKNVGSNYTAQSTNTSTYQTQSQPSYTANGTQANTNTNNGPKHVFQHFEHFSKSMQNAAHNHKNPPSKHENGWAKYAKKTWWQKAKSVFTSPNFRIGVKLAAMLSLQLGMAVIGKKYEINGLGEGAAFVGCMIGVFFLSRELSKEGIDSRSFGF